MKCISYSLFGDPNSFEFPFYLRGVYFNARMNRLLYPNWITWVPLSAKVYNLYKDFFLTLPGLEVTVLEGNPDKCRGMLWRMLPIYYLKGEITHFLCRDADAITTYKEAQAVQEWIDSGLGFHGITD